MSGTRTADRSRVAVRTVGGVTVLTMADGEHRNVLAPQMVEDLVSAFDRAESDGRTRCVVLVGEGPSFCAGAELATLEASASGDFAGIENVYRGFLRVLASPIPVIAVVNGPAVGAGLNLALAADLRLATRSAVFDSRFMNLRLIPGGGHAWMLERSVGREISTAMVVFGEKLDAATALAAGLVWDVLDSVDDAVAAAVALGARLEGSGRDFVGALTHLCRVAPRLPSHSDALDLERYMQRWSTGRPEFLSGVSQMRLVVEGRRAP